MSHYLSSYRNIQFAILTFCKTILPIGLYELSYVISQSGPYYDCSGICLGSVINNSVHWMSCMHCAVGSLLVFAVPAPVVQLGRLKTPRNYSSYWYMILRESDDQVAHSGHPSADEICESLKFYNMAINHTAFCRYRLYSRKRLPLDVHH